MRIIQIQVIDERVVGGGVVAGAAGSGNDVALEISFSPMWSGLGKTIEWWNALGERATITMVGPSELKPGEDSTYIVPIPPEAKSVKGDMAITIRGVDSSDGEVSSATVAETTSFRILRGKWDASANNLTPSQAEQLMKEIEAVHADIPAQIGAHNVSPDAHQDIRESIVTQISEHNTSPGAHQDIRTKISESVRVHNESAESHQDIRQAQQDGDKALREYADATFLSAPRTKAEGKGIYIQDADIGEQVVTVRTRPISNGETVYVGGRNLWGGDREYIIPSGSQSVLYSSNERFESNLYFSCFRLVPEGTLATELHIGIKAQGVGGDQWGYIYSNQHQGSGRFEVELSASPDKPITKIQLYRLNPWEAGGNVSLFDVQLSDVPYKSYTTDETGKTEAVISNPAYITSGSNAPTLSLMYKQPLSPESIKAIPMTEKGSAGGVAPLDKEQKVPAQNMPDYVGGTKSVNGVTPDKDGNVKITASDVGARSDTWMPTASDIGARPNDWMPTAADVGARADDWTPIDDSAPSAGTTYSSEKIEELSKVPAATSSKIGGIIADPATDDDTQEVRIGPDNKLRTAPSGGGGGGVVSVNGKSGAVILNAADVSARPDTWTPTSSDVGARPDSWMPTAADVGARPSDWTPTASDVGARPDTWTPIDDSKPGTGTTYSSGKVEEIIASPQYNNKKISVVASPLGGYTTEPLSKSSDIRNWVNAGGKVELWFDDIITNTGEQVYPYQNFRNNTAYFRRTIIEGNKVSRVNVAVLPDGSVEFEEVPYSIADANFWHTNILVNADFRLPLVSSGRESWTGADTGTFVDGWRKSSGLDCDLTPSGLHCKPNGGGAAYITQVLQDGFPERLSGETLYASSIVDGAGVIGGSFTYQNSPASNIVIFESKSLRIQQGTDNQLYIFIKTESTLSALKLEVGNLPTIGKDAPANPKENELRTNGFKDYVLPAASAKALGGIMADAKTAEDTVPARKGPDNKLYIKPPAIPAVPHVQVVSYVGTGLYGADHPCSISVDFPMKAIIVLGSSEPDGYWINFMGSMRRGANYYAVSYDAKRHPTMGFSDGNGGNQSTGWFSTDKKTFNWCGVSEASQLNIESNTYYLLVFG